MRKSDVVGRRIVGVRQRWESNYGGRFVKVLAVVLDNGDELVPHGYEVPGDVDSTLCLVKREKRRQPKARAGSEKCDECGERVPKIIGCPDGAEICQECFDSGLH